jgi:uncharacterized protein (TIGR02118 family)
MSYRLIVIYNHPADPAAFDAYYDTVHIPLAEQMPNLRKIIAGKIETVDGSTPEKYLQAQVVFGSREEALEGLASPQGQATAADLANFATGGVSMFWVGDDIKVGPEAEETLR